MFVRRRRALGRHGRIGACRVLVVFVVRHRGARGSSRSSCRSPDSRRRATRSSRWRLGDRCIGVDRRDARSWRALASTASVGGRAARRQRRAAARLRRSGWLLGALASGCRARVLAAARLAARHRPGRCGIVARAAASHHARSRSRRRWARRWSAGAICSGARATGRGGARWAIDERRAVRSGASAQSRASRLASLLIVTLAGVFLGARSASRRGSLWAAWVAHLGVELDAGGAVARAGERPAVRRSPDYRYR